MFAPDTEMVSALPQSLGPNGGRITKQISTNNSRSIPVVDNSAAPNSQQDENVNGKRPNSESAGSYSSEEYFRKLYDKANRRQPIQRSVVSRDQVERVFFLVYHLCGLCAQKKIVKLSK